MNTTIDSNSFINYTEAPFRIAFSNTMIYRCFQLHAVIIKL